MSFYLNQSLKILLKSPLPLFFSWFVFLLPLTLLAEDIPSFEELSESKYKPNAQYRIRSFSEGTVESLTGMIEGIKTQAEINLSAIRKLQNSAHAMSYSEKEKYVMALAELKASQLKVVDQISQYELQPYQTNASLEKLRVEQKFLGDQVSNLRNLLSTFNTENSVSWE